MFEILKKIFSANENPSLKEILPDAFLVDVRSRAEFTAGSVTGAVNIPLDSIMQNQNKFKGKKNIVVFCRSGMRSGQAKSILEQLGYTHVFNGGPWQNVQQQLSK